MGQGGAAAGRERICTGVVALVDSKVPLYRFDLRFPDKQERANELLRAAIVDDNVRIAHQAIVEFVSAVTPPVVAG